MKAPRRLAGSLGLSFALLLGASARAEAADDRRREIEAAFEAVVGQLSLPSVEPGEPVYEDLLEQVWGLAGEWVAAYLDEHPDAPARAVVEDLAGLGRGTAHDAGGDTGQLWASAVQLSAGSAPAYAVALSGYWSGTVLVISRQLDGTFREGWSLRDLARRDTAWSEPLERWAATYPGFHDGALAGELLLAPDGPAGEPRFVVDAESLPSMGQNRVAQVSVWEWDGEKAVPIYFHFYDVNPEAHTAALDGDLLRLRVNQPLRCFDVCGSCEGPQAVWSLRLGPDRVEDLGVVSEVPALVQVDELLLRVATGEDASGLASPGVRAGVQRTLAEIEEEYEAVLAPDRRREGAERCFMGMLGSWSGRSEGSGTRLDLEADELRATTFHFRRRDGALYATGVTAQGR